jgi:hypothetical protein
MQKSPEGDIKIDTRRRYKKANSQQVNLGDRLVLLSGKKITKKER